MTAAQRKTPTSSNGGSDDGIDYTNAVDVEIEALWKVVATELISVGGTAAAITATSDTALVAAITAYARPMAFWLTPAADWPGGAGTIDIDGVGNVSLKDQDGADPVAGALKAGRRSLISYTGSAFRIAGASGTSSISQANDVNGGRLTISTGVPVLGAVVTGATQVYWTPDVSNQISLYDGSANWNIIPSAETLIKFTDTQTGTLTSGSKVVGGLTDTSKFIVGMKISGTGVGAGSVIVSIDSPTQVTGSVNSTAPGSSSVTFKVPADTAIDIFGKNVSSSLALRGIARAVFATVNTLAKQDGIDVLSADHTLRYLGTVATGATDGQIDWALGGLRRFRVWNRSNKRRLFNIMSFPSTDTWRWTFGIISMVSEVFGGGGGGGTNSSGGTSSSGGPGGYSIKRHMPAPTADQTVTIGSTSSFGAFHSATSGGTGPGAGADSNGAAPGTGTGGDSNITGAGMPGGSGATGSTGRAGNAGGSSWIKVSEIVEF